MLWGNDLGKGGWECRWRFLHGGMADKTQIPATAETVRLYLHAAGYVCKRPTWTLKRQAEEQPGSVRNACGWR